MWFYKIPHDYASSQNNENWNKRTHFLAFPYEIILYKRMPANITITGLLNLVPARVIRTIEAPITSSQVGKVCLNVVGGSATVAALAEIGDC